MKNKKYQYWLSCAPGIGGKTIERLLQVFKTEQALYQAKEKQLAGLLSAKQLEAFLAFRSHTDPERSYELLRKRGIAFYTRQDSEYPGRLRKLAAPPYGIYVLGEMPGEHTPAVAIIGARECSEYGSYVAKEFAKALAHKGVAVISGMARGIDGIGQQEALAAGGKTYAVLGCGVDVPYPVSNRRLYEQILEKGGGILSVFPPGTQPRRQLFPERNRIVAGLCDVLLVVEARQKSGTWITVDMALEQGKSIYAVPGRLTDRLSDGCNMLIRQGAGIALAPEDLLAELSLLANCREIGAAKEKPERKEQEQTEQGQETDKLMAALDLQPLPLERIYARLQEAGEDMTLTELMTKLVNLCLDGKVRQIGGNHFAKRMQ